MLRRAARARYTEDGDGGYQWGYTLCPAMQLGADEPLASDPCDAGATTADAPAHVEADSHL